jgi:hypothetical protein
MIMNFILLTLTNGRPVAVATDAIDLLCPCPVDNGKTTVGLKGSEENYTTVKEPFEDVVYTLGQAGATVWRVRPAPNTSPLPVVDLGEPEEK